ncbi:MAG TPA: hypothetical protein PLD49_09925 [Thermoclostridium caenicola]|uniref:Uncharacterized protein n=1 Tax=Thermoclostridium caenicola TaxID=659425 RepID=A0A1M6APY7_9FIRM|nr:hypothetical protein [Thermoclostridium caenicola]SHI38501.1 hypothetical protein SAMN05444373_1001120 [Thermoclostridium caenicola]HOK43969.1 hypothetical protein [Thermoclostridium caenicola]HOL83975.1 hypothetical protein [Thermoclostridium caenicola]HOP71983.1 hypothetical protein [Thermoclostridium caenicola]HPO76003.1 hypothetical protein [Thermoclostridium caenicola]
MGSKEKRKDKRITGDTKGDPAFYNDQIGENLEPMKANMDQKKGRK